ncbi:MAG: tRNA (adenosine(37)-N6)-threonylcarbamoyltransferase complex ATPase subunit type 1 TsaE [Rhodospirillales bacterium]|nr:tRNA (adenosine(37)-N6)-threonylcarbamoyltransferase complex ATPase subunit type 1 TsaE [Rhodospirillales bacterium]
MTAGKPGRNPARAEAPVPAGGKRPLSIRLDLPDEAATRALAVRLAAAARAGDVFGLKGPLGAGKTAFARAFVAARAALAGVDVAEVPSPTFTLVQTYDFPGDPGQSPTVFHIDLYRIESPAEAVELGLDEAFATGISLVEWPERLGDLLPRSRIEIAFAPGPDDNARIVEIEGFGEGRKRLKEAGYRDR